MANVTISGCILKYRMEKVYSCKKQPSFRSGLKELQNGIGFQRINVNSKGIILYLEYQSVCRFVLIGSPRRAESCVCSASSLVPLSSIEDSCVLIGSYFQTLSGVLRMFGVLIGTSVKYCISLFSESCVLIVSYFQTLSGVLRMFGLLIGPFF